jgi:hypothetical protein
VTLHTEDGRAWWACRDCGVPFAPAASPPALRPATDAVDDHPAPEYVSIHDLCRRIPYREGTIRNLMSSGVFKPGEHYVKANGRVVFLWSAVEAWLRESKAR